MNKLYKMTITEIKKHAESQFGLTWDALVEYYAGMNELELLAEIKEFEFGNPTDARDWLYWALQQAA